MSLGVVGWCCWLCVWFSSLSGLGKASYITLVSPFNSTWPLYALDGPFLSQLVCRCPRTSVQVGTVLYGAVPVRRRAYCWGLVRGGLRRCRCGDLGIFKDAPGPSLTRNHSHWRVITYASRGMWPHQLGLGLRRMQNGDHESTQALSPLVTLLAASPNGHLAWLKEKRHVKRFYLLRERAGSEHSRARKKFASRLYQFWLGKARAGEGWAGGHRYLIACVCRFCSTYL
jgi:hypothetical protein